MKQHRAGLGFAAVLLFAALTVVMTWPQARYMGTRVPNADDPLLSIWRIAWIAHILPTSPADLVNGNIFYPEKRTLAYTDSVLLQGVTAAPFIWAGLSPVFTYNLLMLASIALSGWAMWLYAFHLTHSVGASVIAGIIFAFVPFRFDHLHHLELQATMFLPLALLAIDRAFDSGERRAIGLAVAAVVAQVYCGIYYAVFLATALLIVIPLRLHGCPPDRRRAIIRRGLIASAIGAAIVAPYLLVYLLNRSSLGERADSDVLLYSATLWNYLSTPEHNVAYGSWAGPLGLNERRLFPGFLALAMAGIGLIGLERRRVTLLVIGATGFIISMGVNTPLYEPIRSVLFIYRGLRAPARASILVFLAIAALAAFGWSRLEQRFSRRPAAVAALAALVLLLEYATVQTHWFIIEPRPPGVYQWLATQPRSVVLELPVATADRLDIAPDGLYMLHGIGHWQPTLNGYSGFFPVSFIELTERMKTFPDESSIQYLKERGVELVILHGGLLPPDTFGELTSKLLGRQDFAVKARFEEPRGPDIVFQLSR